MSCQDMRHLQSKLLDEMRIAVKLDCGSHGNAVMTVPLSQQQRILLA